MLEAEGLTEELRLKWALLPVGLRRQVLDFVEFLVVRYQLFRSGPALESEVSSDGADAPRPRVLGLHQDMGWISEDFNDPLPDEFWLGKVP